MTTPFLPRTSSALLLCACTLGAAWAQETPRSPTLYAQVGLGEHSVNAITVGGTLPWNSWTFSLWGSEVRGHWDLYMSRWSFHADPGRHGSLMLFGATPTLRLHPNGGRSIWFWEAGVGPTVSNRRYIAQRKEFGLRFNFASHLGVGVYLGERRQHELLLRVQHLSNASIKKPNPGENFVQLRYAHTL